MFVNINLRYNEECISLVMDIKNNYNCCNICDNDDFTPLIYDM